MRSRYSRRADKLPAYLLRGVVRRQSRDRAPAGMRVNILGRSAIFIAEIGDKTQVATVLLAARYSPLWQVIAGTTLGMLLANVPVVVLGSRFANRLPLRTARIVAALVFLALGAWAALRGLDDLVLAGVAFDDSSFGPSISPASESPPG